MVVSETLNCEREVKNPQSHYTVAGLRKYVTTVGYVLRMCHLIHLHMIFNKAWWCHRAHFDWPTTVFPTLATERSRIASTVIYYLVRSFIYLTYNSRINSSYIYSSYSHGVRHEKCENSLDNLHPRNLTTKILIPCLTVKYACHKNSMCTVAIWFAAFVWAIVDESE